MNDLPRRAWVDIDLGALVRNAQTLQRRAAVPLLPMVKADAYGLGALPVVRALERLQPWGYGIATVAEGEELRAADIARPLLLCTPPLPEEFPAIRSARLTPALGSAATIAAWLDSGGGPWHLAIDTGMRRAGVPCDEIDTVVELARRAPPEGALTHFHSADSDRAATEEQQNLFEDAVAALPERPRFLHAENSPSLEWQSPSSWDLVRPGIFIYGVSTARESAVAAQPVAHLRGRVVEIRSVPAGGGVSYGHTWHAPQGTPRRVATVNAGYADGVKRALGNRATALMNGRSVPLVGVVTMDMTLVDVTDVPCDPGDVVTFFGRDGDAVLELAAVARAADISPYEVLTGLRGRAERRYQGP